MLPIPAIVGAGAGLLSQGINAVTQHAQNQQNWEYAKEAYSRERADNLSDWNRNNAYNHPAEQMARLKAAGLNPNMVYGNGGATTIAQPVKGASQTSPQGQPVQFDLGGIVQNFIAAMQMQQQTDNLREINKNLELRNQGEKLKNVLTDVNISRADRALRMDDIKLGSAQKIIDTSLEAQRIKNALGNAQTTYTTDRNTREALLTTQSIKEGANRLLQQALQRNLTKAQTDQVKAAIKKLQADTKISQFEIQLNKSGITKSDAGWLRIAKTLLDGYLPDFLKSGN